MKQNKFPFKRLIIKSVIICVYFVIVLFIFGLTKAGAMFDTYLYYDNFKVTVWLLLVLYRTFLYVLCPLIMSFLENFIVSRKHIPFKNKLIENLNSQFLTYTLISAFYILLGFDRILDAEIFHSSDSFIFIGSFLFTILLNKSFPHLFYDNDEDNS